MKDRKGVEGGVPSRNGLVTRVCYDCYGIMTATAVAKWLPEHPQTMDWNDIKVPIFSPSQKITLLGLCVCACLCACLPLEIQNCSLYSWNVPIVATKSGTCFLNRKHQETLRPTKPGCTCNVKRLDAFLWVLSLIMILCLIIDSDSGAPQSTNLHGCRNMPKGSQKWWVYGCGIRMPWFCTTRRSSWGLNFSYFDFIIFSIFLDMLEPYRFQTIPTSKQVAPIVM